MRLRDRLDGKTIGLTGVTGFVGEALLQRILTDLPGTRAYVVVRAKGATTARERIEKILRKKTFTAAGTRSAATRSRCERRGSRYSKPTCRPA